MPRVTHAPAGVEQPFAREVPRGWSETKLAKVIQETGERRPTCRCDLNARMTVDDLVALGAGCGRAGVCERLAAVRRRMGL